MRRKIYATENLCDGENERAYTGYPNISVLDLIPLGILYEGCPVCGI